MFQALVVSVLPLRQHPGPIEATQDRRKPDQTSLPAIAGTTGRAINALYLGPQPDACRRADEPTHTDKPTFPGRCASGQQQAPPSAFVDFKNFPANPANGYSVTVEVDASQIYQQKFLIAQGTSPSAGPGFGGFLVAGWGLDRNTERHNRLHCHRLDIAAKDVLDNHQDRHQHRATYRRAATDRQRDGKRLTKRPGEGRAESVAIPSQRMGAVVRPHR